MKKYILIIPFLSVLICLMYVNAGPNMWTQLLTGSGAIWQDCIKINSTNGSIIYAGSSTSGIYKTTNAGQNWVTSNSGLTNTVLQALDISKSNPNFLVTASTNTGSSPGLYHSTDGAATWSLSNNGITDPLLAQQIAIDPVNPNNVYIGIFNGTANSTVGVWKSTDGGNNWTAANTGIGTIKNILSIVINPKNPNVLYCGTSFDPVTSTGPVHIYKSVNGAASWTDVSTGLPSLGTEINPIRCLSISTLDTSIVLAGLFMNTTTGGAYLTTNGGGSWTRIHNPGLPTVVGTLIRSCLIRPGSNSEFFVGLDGAGPNGVFRSTDRGVTWTQFASGPLSATAVVRALTFKTAPDSTLYAGVAGTSGQGVYEYAFIPVGISNQGSNLPKEFALHQNYPNPFNPTTVISFDLPKDANVAVSIYDVSGRIVKTLMNEYKKAGSYQLNYDASKLSSGIYFYNIIAGNFIDTKKMILVK